MFTDLSFGSCIKAISTSFQADTECCISGASTYWRSTAKYSKLTAAAWVRWLSHHLAQDDTVKPGRDR